MLAALRQVLAVFGKAVRAVAALDPHDGELGLDVALQVDHASEMSGPSKNLVGRAVGLPEHGGQVLVSTIVHGYLGRSAGLTGRKVRRIESGRQSTSDLLGGDRQSLTSLARPVARDDVRLGRKMSVWNTLDDDEIQMLACTLAYFHERETKILSQSSRLKRDRTPPVALLALVNFRTMVWLADYYLTNPQAYRRSLSKAVGLEGGEASKLEGREPSKPTAIDLFPDHVVADMAEQYRQSLLPSLPRATFDKLRRAKYRHFVALLQAHPILRNALQLRDVPKPVTLQNLEQRLRRK